MTELTRRRYVDLYGPTTGDRIRLADTDLLVEAERDLCGGPGRAGDEAVFGGGKVIRESMGQSRAGRAEGTPDTVVTGAVVLDHWGVVKADIGIRDGRITALGKAGNPETMDGVHPDLVIGPETEIVSGNGKILTAGGIDAHVHFVCPQIADEALAAGITTLVGGGTGPAEGTKATTITPGAWHLARMFEAMDAVPVNVGLLGKGNTVSTESMRDQLRAGAVGFKIHEDWGATPAAIDACLRVCDATGVQLAIHTDTLNEAGFVEDTLAAIAGRGIHTYHTEGAGGGHAPDIITVVSQPNVLPSSTNPTRPHTVNTIDEHLDMLMVCHHLNPAVPEDLAFAESRIRPSTIAAEDVLHDLGAISMISSDSQAMGRVGEVVLRTWQTAHVMKKRRGSLPGDTAADNHRARRYVAKYTINPAVAQGLHHEIGSVEQGKLADLVLWDPAFFGVRPHLVIKGGQIAWAQMGDANASIPTPQPVLPRPMFGGIGRAASSGSLTFVAEAAVEAGLPERLGLNKPFTAITGTRTLTKDDMRENTARPRVEVDPDTFTVSIDGDIVDPDPATELPMAQRYFLFYGNRMETSGTDAATCPRQGARTALLLLADGRFPTGGHAHSGGAEAAVHAGSVHDPRSLEHFCRGRLHTAGLTAAAIAAAAAGGMDPLALDAAAQARTPSPALRATSRKLGRQFIRAARSAWPSPALDGLAAALPRGAHHSVVLGLAASCAGLTPHDAAHVALYESITGPAAAAVRLLSLDPFVVGAVLAGLAPESDRVAHTAAAAAERALHDGVDALPAASAPLLDLLAERHAHWEVRLFAS